MSVEPHVFQDLSGDSKTIEPGRHSAVHGNLQNDLADFVLGDTVVQRPANVDFQLVRTIESRNHSEVEDAAAAAV